MWWFATYFSYFWVGWKTCYEYVLHSWAMLKGPVLMPPTAQETRDNGGSFSSLWFLSWYRSVTTVGGFKCFLMKEVHIATHVPCTIFTNMVHSLKLTKIGHPKRKLVFQPSIFRCYVSFIHWVYRSNVFDHLVISRTVASGQSLLT